MLAWFLSTSMNVTTHGIEANHLASAGSKYEKSFIRCSVSIRDFPATICCFPNAISKGKYLRLGDDTEYVASFQWEGNSFGWSEERAGQLGVRIMADNIHKLVPEATDHAWRHALTEISQRSGNQELMLVENVQGVEMPENLSGPSTIWLDTVNRFYSLWPWSLYSGFHGFEFFGIDRDGKVQLGNGPGRSLATTIKACAKWSRAVLML
jgi:hypothetical protein